MARFKAGIDGGGTSCRARVVDDEGRLIGEAKSGSANIMLGAQLAMDAIIETVSNALSQGGYDAAELSQVEVGLALAGAEHKASYQDFMNTPHPFASVTLNTDGYGACLGAHQGKDGAIMIAGTGSVGLFISNGEQQVVGGREFPISDQGGGAVMGLRLIQEVLLIQDGIGAPSPLADIVMNHFDHDIDRIVDWSKSALPRDYGQFSPAIFEYAYLNDGLAKKLLLQTAQDIEMLLTALNQRGAKEICLMGSIAERIFDWLSPAAQRWIVSPKGDAMDGALMMAGHSAHNLYD
ncbi:BadF/BadG/BcrA/BcrD ATPase family protein [Vibrio hangzhouensis]|uniref:BadF/BadG/BcrA/BcrD ATPase family protein n=1 Tax=Vibrio hangzhouensis TaxID=462991 RepID=UPI001C986C7F|nr:BadF/BadG/BcrA/BcrD ATPase family protein [Vibrio hangzhouensis]MBY6197035.1 N-acetylglucosamine kinase [Vibrio hangzhouensis]